MYLMHRKAGYIDRRSVRQAYDETAKMFLPDRYVKGICPVCAKPDQYGDSCENCGSTYTPADLKNPDFGGQRNRAGMARIRAFFLPLERLRDLFERLGGQRRGAGQCGAQAR